MHLRSRRVDSSTDQQVDPDKISVEPRLGYFQKPGYFTPITKMTWIPHRSIAIGSSSFLYAVPFLWGAMPTYLLQAFLSFGSDYVMIGKDSWFHPCDRMLALFNSMLIVTSAFWAIEWWEVLLLVLATYTQYAFSVWAIKKRRWKVFQVAHTLWHIVGSGSIAYVVINGCGWRTSFSLTCERKWVGGLYCNCLGLSKYP